MSSHFLVGANVQLGDMDVLHYCRVFRQGGIYIFHTWAVDVVMPLHTDTVDGYTFFFHGLHHVVDAVALLGIGGIVIIIEKEYVGVGLASVDKGFLDEFIACYLIEGRVAVGAGLLSHDRPSAVGNCFIHYIPCVYHVFVTFHNSCDVVFHVLEQFFFGYKISFFILIHPFPYLCMPHQAVPAKFDSVAAAEVGDFVGVFPVELSVGGFGGLRLHVVLGRNAVEVFFDDGNLFGICDVLHVDSHTDREVILVGILQPCCTALGESCVCSHGKGQCTKG